MKSVQQPEILVSLPPAMSTTFAQVHHERSGDVFVTSDPPGTQLGSGGGTVHLLLDAFRTNSKSDSFTDWISESPKMLIHGSGESRRLQAYSSEGKPMMPIPDLPLGIGRPPQPVLLDIQIDSYSRIARLAPDEYRVMVTCGDVYLSFSELLPAFPEADILFVGMQAPPEEAQNHGVMVTKTSDMSHLLRFLQKPSMQDLESLSNQETYLLDTGIWLFSEKAVRTLMSKCGINAADLTSKSTCRPKPYDMFSTFGPALGETPVNHDSDISTLQGAVLPLPDSKFYHFGSSRSIMASTGALLAPAEDKRSYANAPLESFGSPVIIGGSVTCKLDSATRHIWIEGSCVQDGWQLHQNHIITGIPENCWQLDLPEGVCLTIIPVPGGDALKFYGFDDPMRGSIEDGVTLLGSELANWCSQRGIEPDKAGISTTTDIYDIPLFPVLEDTAKDGDFVQWLVSSTPAVNENFAGKYIQSKRLSARDLLLAADLKAVEARRRADLLKALRKIMNSSESWIDACREYDLSKLSSILVSQKIPLPKHNIEWSTDAAPQTALAAVHERMLLDECGTGQADEAFSILRDLIVHEMEISSISPKRNVLDDQLVWGRSPLRLDLAGGWSDTPPFCLENGGRVTNLAVDLNGQPPIQVFARINDRKDILLRSIDLGVSETIPSFEALLKPVALGSEFGIARAALALSGFDPRFHTNHNYRTLQKQLDTEFGGGIELSMVCAVPKGSGLGTSSVLAATVIGTLNELCGLGFDTKAISRRTMALEQILTSGGGWQDQIGGITRGVKLITTSPSIMQDAQISWLPGRLFEEGYANRTVLLYYTGITRVAHDILGEIVRNMFLNSSSHLSIVKDISANALFAAEACQRNDWNQLCHSVNRSWRLNQLLDAGTNPPQVQAVLDRVGDYLSASKLLGAGGGGYMLMLAKDDLAAEKIRKELTERPPNRSSRFVELTLSQTGLQITKS